ncbi:MAG: hypothetical protein IT429_06730 [Gemmataceae bacterium]|nr:hypothetical protein [Gemmataceae bacterium]
MLSPRLRLLALLAVLSGLVVALPAPGQVTGSKAALIVFKDGFTVRGRIKQDTTFLIDPASKQSFTVPVTGGFFRVEDGARTVIFSPGQVHEVVRDDPNANLKPVRLTTHIADITGYGPPSRWTLDETTPFNRKWERLAYVTTDKGPRQIEQRLVVLTPHYLRVDARKDGWICYYLTRELTPDVVRDLVNKHIVMTRKPDKEIDRRLLVYRFLLQAGWTHEAERELDRTIAALPAERDRLKELKAGLDRLTAAQFVVSIKRAHQVGQHEEARTRLARFDELKMAPLTDDKALLALQDLRNKYEAAGRKIKDVHRFLEVLPGDTPPIKRDLYRDAVQTILTELTFDTAPRLETFVSQSLDWERARKANRPPAQNPEELLAFAISGWLLGDGAADKNVPRAQRLWEARQLVLDVLKDPTDSVARKSRAGAFEKDKLVGVDVIARMIPLLPPADPYDKDKLNTAPMEMKVEAQGPGLGTPYHLQLPPEYNHYRPHPVLVVLNHSEEKPADTLARWTDLAAQHGYIVVAPEWAQGKKAAYGFSYREHATVLGTLRDLRRRFQIDSDRVFLFGCEEGGRMAFDVGLSHPDQFAGVLPMSAAPRFYGFRYWTNAQHLPFYVVSGELTGELRKHNRTQFKDWVKRGYPSLNIEYTGRPAEWFTAEPEMMIDWMNGKRRANPIKELAWGDEFRTMRATDNRFYWLSTDAIQPRCLNAVETWNPNLRPAALEARMAGTANQVNVKTHGLNQVTVWLGPGMIDYGQKLTLFVNGTRVYPRDPVTPNLDTLLEELIRTGDRQRLFWRKIELRVS